MRRRVTGKGIGRSWVETEGSEEEHGLEMRLRLGFGGDRKRREEKEKVIVEKEYDSLRKIVHVLKLYRVH